MGALLFQRRLLVMSLAFGAAVFSMVASSRAAASGIWLLQPIWVALGETFPPTITFLVSGAFCVLAFLLRVASEARLGAAVYGQGATRGLVDEGPFSRVRNPLYVATWMFFVAATSVWAPWTVWLLLSAAFAAALHLMVLHEELLLGGLLGAPYLGYLQRVPRWLPRSGGASSSSPTGPLLPAVMGNIGFGSLGLYRMAVALGGDVQVLGAVNVALLLTWLIIVISRRFEMARSSRK